MLKEQPTWLNLPYKFSFDCSNGDSMRHILVINNGSLLEEGVVRLLTSQEGLDVLSIDFESEESLVRELDTLHPDVLIINREGPVNLANFFSLLAGTSNFNHLQTLIISADSNIIDVYENQQVCELHSQDFFDFLNRLDVKG